MKCSIVDTASGVVVRERKNQALTFDVIPGRTRIDLPGQPAQEIHAASPGDNAGDYYIYPVNYIDVGTGSEIATSSDPVYDRESDKVIVERTLQASPAPQTEAEEAEAQMVRDRFLRAWVKREAAKEGKTARQIMDEIISEAE
jgi:hypothetical protein|tara:strand:+ start:448 stop:876 length:429 start_codon:yes stop_codon:yes gene_type:complete